MEFMLVNCSESKRPGDRPMPMIIGTGVVVLTSAYRPLTRPIMTVLTISARR